ncbi:MAG: hypothetical protein QOH12_73 [Solirubrobacteraceae bacterium]|jgi:hypothetical protein|nr:hypothetical protein [Solirubrobacteraceae bacterium]
MPERFDWPNAVFEKGNLTLPLVNDETPEWCGAFGYRLSDALAHLTSVSATGVSVDPRTKKIVVTKVVGNEKSIPAAVDQAGEQADIHEAQRAEERARASAAFEHQKRTQVAEDLRRTQQIREAAKS